MGENQERLYLSGMDFGTYVRDRRELLGMSQPELGKAVGVTGQAVHGWEMGKSYPKAHHLPGIARKLGVSIDFLFTGPTDPELDWLLGLWPKISPEDRKTVIKLLNALAPA